MIKNIQLEINVILPDKMGGNVKLDIEMTLPEGLISFDEMAEHEMKNYANIIEYMHTSIAGNADDRTLSDYEDGLTEEGKHYIDNLVMYMMIDKYGEEIYSEYIMDIAVGGNDEKSK